jgi:hypothetical protein
MEARSARRSTSHSIAQGIGLASRMALLEEIRDKALRGEFEFSQHAVDQAVLRQIEVRELREAMANAEIIEDYPLDKYGPSCLLLGFTSAGRPLHVQMSYPSRPRLKVITVYEPDPGLWAEFRRRRRSR